MPTDNSRDYRVRNVVKNVMGDSWVILPGKLEEIVSLLEARADGIIPTEAELNDRFGSELSANQGDDGPVIIDGVQVIDVFGTLAPRMNLMSKFSGGTSTQNLAKELAAAEQNDQVQAVILRIDSPGGAYSYTPEAAAAVRALGRKKRVVSSATNMMASGAYWIGSAADEVYASESTYVGSVGVYSVVQNSTEAYEKAGHKFTVFRAGKLKAAGLPYEELSETHRESLQSKVDEIYSDFIAAVAEHRGLTPKTIESTFGQGSTVLANEAQSRGMVDGVATFEEVLGRERDRIQGPSNSVRINITEEEVDMDKRVKAALYARGLIVSMDVSDEIAQASLSSFCSVAGVDDSQEPAALAQAIGAYQSAASTAVPSPEEAAKTPPARNLAIEERVRIQTIRDRAAVLNVGEDQVQAAIDSGVTPATAVDEWVASRAASQEPVVPVPVEAQADRVASVAGAIMSQRLGHPLTEDEARSVRDYGSDLKNRRMTDMLRVMLSSAGERVNTLDDNAVAAKFLAQPGDLLVAGSTANRRGDHPDMLSSLVRKSLTAGAVVAPTTYQQWCDRLEDLPDFKPSSFIETGVFHALDAVMEDGSLKELKFDSNLVNWIKVERYGAKTGLTIEMIVDDNLGGFSRQLASIAGASRRTLARAIHEHFHSNPTMMDGIAFFHADHNNIATAGAPSSTTFQDHRKIHRRQKSYGSPDPMGLTFDRVLVPVEHEDAALRATTRVLDENKTPATDANINTFRGQVEPIVDSFIDEYDTNAWYSLLPPQIAAAVFYAFQSGYGESGRQKEWMDDETGTRYIGIETRFGVAMGNWRAIVKNPGV